MRIYGKKTPSIKALASRLADVDVKIRWGGPQVPGALNGDCYVMNKLEQLVDFTEKDIPVPEFTEDVEVASKWIRERHPAFGRKLNHSQGRDIQIVVGADLRWMNSDFWTKFVKSVGEWRFHIFNGKSIARGKKVCETPMEAYAPIRTRAFGYRLVHNVEPPKGLRTLAKRAVEAVGYDFGAVDVLELADGSGVVLEVNSRPGLKDPYTLDKYEKAIRLWHNDNPVEST